MQNFLNKPHYIFRPSQIVRRLIRRAPDTVNLPWGLPISINPNEDIGHSLATTGIYDLTVSEALWRLTDSSDVALDVGANIGYMSALLSVRAASVISFEPHPQLFERLSLNIQRWKANIEIHQLALSDRSGEALLSLSEAFERNEGVGSISYPSVTGRNIKVQTVKLSDLKIDNIRIAKIDVEGHELNVLRGAGPLVGQLRDIVFEEHGTIPTPTTQYLHARGYELFYVGRKMFGPSLISIQTSPKRRDPYAPQSLLATLDVARAQKRMKPLGWRVLKSSFQEHTPS
jgi:FkbM family methyltransferase